MRQLVLFTSVALLISLPGCSLVGGEDTEEFNPGIQSLSVPDQISAEENLRVEVSLLFGSQNCTEFKSIDVDKSEGRAVIEATARRYPDRTCLDMAISVDTTLTLSPPYEDPFTVVGNRSDSEDLVQEVRVQ